MLPVCAVQNSHSPSIIFLKWIPYLLRMQTINFLKVVICDCEIDLTKMSVMCQILLVRLHFVLSKAVEPLRNVMYCFGFQNLEIEIWEQMLLVA